MKRKRIITSLKGGKAMPRWMCYKLSGTLMQAYIDHEKEMQARVERGEANPEDDIDQDFGEFVEDRFVEMYGLKNVAHDNLRDFIKSLKKHSAEHKRLQVFRILSALVPGDENGDENDLTLSPGAAIFYRTALRRVVDTATNDHMSKLKGSAFWTHFAKPDVVKLPVLYFEKVTEKLAAAVKKMQAESEAGRSEDLKEVIFAVRALKAFESTLRDHDGEALDDLPDRPGEDGSRSKVNVYGDATAGRGSVKGNKVAKPICVDCFLDRALQYWNDYENREAEDLEIAFESWDLNGNGLLELDEFSEMIRASNPTQDISQRKITRAFASASSGGDHVDKARLSTALLAYGLKLVERPPGMSLDAKDAPSEEAGPGNAASAEGRLRQTVPTVANAMVRIGQMTKVMRGLTLNNLVDSSELDVTEEEVSAHIVETS